MGTQYVPICADSSLSDGARTAMPLGGAEIAGVAETLADRRQVGIELIEAANRNHVCPLHLLGREAETSSRLNLARSRVRTFLDRSSDRVPSSQAARFV
jgi:hypothetical protein